MSAKLDGVLGLHKEGLGFSYTAAEFVKELCYSIQQL